MFINKGTQLKIGVNNIWILNSENQKERKREWKITGTMDWFLLDFLLVLYIKIELCFSGLSLDGTAREAVKVPILETPEIKAIFKNQEDGYTKLLESWSSNISGKF